MSQCFTAQLSGLAKYYVLPKPDDIPPDEADGEEAPDADLPDPEVPPVPDEDCAG